MQINVYTKKSVLVFFACRLNRTDVNITSSPYFLTRLSNVPA